MKRKRCNKCNIVKPIDEFYSQYKVNAKGVEYIYHRPDCKECTSNSASVWRKNNREKHVRSTQKYYKNNPQAYEKVKARVKKRRQNGFQLLWQRQNKDKIRNYRLKHRNHDITSKEWESCLRYFNYKCAYCGIHQDDAKEEYDNYLHKEHVSHDGANDLSNCIPACKVCNSSKHQADIDEWYNISNPIYSKRRYNKIQKWLESDYIKYKSN